MTVGSSASAVKPETRDSPQGDLLVVSHLQRSRFHRSSDGSEIACRRYQSRVGLCLLAEIHTRRKMTPDRGRHMTINRSLANGKVGSERHVARYLAIVVATLGLTIAAARPAHAIPINLVNNGGFETGNFTGWTTGGNTDFTGVQCPGASPLVPEGICDAFMGPIGSDGTLSQAIPTVVAQPYIISFAFMSDGGLERFSHWCSARGSGSGSLILCSEYTGNEYRARARRVAGVGRRRLVGAAEPRSPVRTLTVTRRSRGCSTDVCQGVLLAMGHPHGTDHRVGDRRGQNLRPAVSAIQTARAFRSSAPDTGRTPVCASGGPPAAAFGAVADTDRLEGDRGDSSRRLRWPRSVTRGQPPPVHAAIDRRGNHP